MPYTEFVHLHVHTDYSIKDGACRIYDRRKQHKDIVQLAQKYKMSAVAITDNGVMRDA